MAKFLTENDLNTEIGRIFENAKELLILISPFIKLHDRSESILKTKKDKPDIEIILVFGKNEKNPGASMSKEDLEFFKDFPNIQIRYEKRLHAKYYANETSAILTSMNLHQFSQDNNIEFGIMVKSKIFNVVGDDLDSKAYEYFDRVIQQSDLLYETKPEFDKGFLGSGVIKKFLKYNVTVNNLDEFFSRNTKQTSVIQKVKSVDKYKPESSYTQESHYGYCIRTGVPIPLNIKRPFCEEAYQNWSKHKNSDYKEKYCHFSGEPSYGETSYSKPILNKNWKKAQRLIDN